MMRWILLLLIPGMANAEAVLATRTIRANTILMPSDVALAPAAIPGALEEVETAIGMETRVTLYAGRPVRPGDLGPPAIVDRNQLVPLAYQSGGLSILTEGRALGRGGVGDMIRVMNLASRTTVTGRIGADGQVQVGPTF
ncbi:flagellar basal body P-ring formation chaperone FlgA [Cereibacter sp. SYSU M97828]|nr:flagellar basal body P-ring formation chaperone FlgA [Cereibacter flavus]